MNKFKFTLMLVLLVLLIFRVSAKNEINKPIKGFNLNKEELEAHLVLAKNDNIESMMVLVKYYRFVNYKPNDAIRWYERAAELGSLKAMIGFSGLVILKKITEKYDIAYAHLKLASSVGDSYSKSQLTNLCQEYKGCKYTVLDELIELVIRNQWGQSI